MPNPLLVPTGLRSLFRGGFQLREQEYRHALRYLDGADFILDVGCGTGTFLQKAPARIVGIDINPENVAHCLTAGLSAQVGDALALPFPDSSFDGLFCSHVIQVFTPEKTVRFLQEASRVVRPGGLVVLSTLADFRRFWRHPENIRPYPPDALWSLCNNVRAGATSPMFAAPPALSQESIYLRRPPLWDVHSRTNPALEGRFQSLRLLQLRLGLVKFWDFEAYTVKLRNLKPGPA